ncbi:glycosyltransferase [Clostridium botulinum]|uniref:Glycosyltransferase family 4 protein n=1 Tax=Clostridium botulinum TaxID=1491 RepID=A0A6G4EHU5_CLOBO|nr:glycosyltransferase [Clostridium botulinum]APH18610.1 glycosyl transferases group 1 family protein [Clostridium botulinum]AUM92202.1 hypothetical protein RSJ5_13290 [Clostridium botulinum]NFB12580.1 glycosyl transferase [Clostridium botulinum]NFH59493.1 glycosyltransferase family 4 protein [Clostridium botulinum]NFH62817.1 glycosyltransferase family 4 protein [Clostridium botulinum]
MKKVLIIAYYFPPLGWSGVQRTLKFVKYLKDFGWQPIVVTVGKTRFSISDKSLLNEIPEDVEVIRIDDVKFKDITDEIKERMREYSKYSFNIISDENLKVEYEKEIESTLEKLRNLFLLPDGNAVWANNVVREISNRINLNNISIVYTTSAPYSTHLVGYYLKKYYKLPWIADFRDEWTNNPYYNFDVKNIRYKIEKNLEKSLIDFSDKIITTTSMARDNYIKLFNLHQNKAITITNGYDEEDYMLLNHSKVNAKFSVVSNGSFYLDRNPYTFLKAIKNILRMKLIKEDDIEIIFIGTIENEIKNNIEAMDINNIIKYEGYMPHLKSLHKANSANLLLLVVGREDKVKSIFPGKVFEYLRLKKPILALSPRKSVVEELLNETKSGINVEYDDIKSIENSVLEYYNNWKYEKRFQLNENEIKKYERKNLTKKLAEIFDGILEE